MDSNFIRVHDNLGMAYIQKSMCKEAAAECEKALVISPGNIEALSGLWYAYAVAGRKAEAGNVLVQLTELSKQDHVPGWFVALLYAGLGKKDQAFKWLQKSYEDLSIGESTIKGDPIFDPLRSDPRFADLLRRMNLQP